VQRNLIRRSRRPNGGQGAHRVEDTVNIEGWVDEQRCIEDHVPNIAALVKLRGFAGERQETLGWVRDVLRYVIRIITLCRDRV